jgi:hypothetical protein
MNRNRKLSILAAALAVGLCGACSKKETGVSPRASAAAPGAQSPQPPGGAGATGAPGATSKPAAPATGAAPELVDLEDLDLAGIPTQSEADALAAQRITEENWREELDKLEQQLAGGHAPGDK